LVSIKIDQTCDVWWQNNLTIVERENPAEFENWVEHRIFNEPVIGKICNY
jgi:hypothetical protein